MAQQLLGWWLFDSDRNEIIHASTGQFLRYLGRSKCVAELAETANHAWMRFDYQDHDIRFPLLIEWRNIPSKVAGRPLVWRVDYIRSATLWRTETNTQQAFPAYGLWRRVDDFLTDALACWPAHPRTGAKPGRIALNGGWLNGIWTAAFYRSISGTTPLLQTTEAFQSAVIEPLTSKSPSPWRLVPPAEGDGGSPLLRFGAADAWTDVQTAVRTRSHLGTDDGSRLLAALPAAGNRRWNLKGLTRLLYADETAVADVAHVGIWDHRRWELPKWSVLLTNGTPEYLFDKITNQKIEMVASKSVLPGGTVSKAGYTPYFLERRLAHACVDAWLSQSDPSWSYADVPDRHDAMSVPAAMVSVSWTLGGSVQSSHLEALASLDAELGGKPNPLSFMFDEENDGIARGSSSFVTAGFWRFEPATRSLVNMLSGQRLRYQEHLNVSETHGQSVARGGRVWLFRYEDSDFAYPLVVLSRLLRATGVLVYGWIVDHERSKVLWQQQEKRQDPPPFGLWQRVSECAADALLCWPEIEETGPPPYDITSAAGWFNGEWSRAIRRRRDRGFEHSFVDSDVPVELFLPEVSAPVRRWRFVDAPQALSDTSLAHMQQLESSWLYLPAEAELTGFETAVPHLRRDDDCAVMFPGGLQSRLYRGEDYDARAFFLYADEDVFFCLHGSEFGGWRALRSGWTFELTDPFRIGLRHMERFDTSQSDGVPAVYFEHVPIPDLVKFMPRARRIKPSPNLTVRVTTALIDGWLSWTGTSKRMLDDSGHLEKLRKGVGATVPPLDRSGIDLGRKSQVRVQGAYVGGRFNTDAATTAWLEADPVIAE